MSRPKISIGLPVYNGERYLKEAVSSLLAQSYEDFELIISDNCSIDSTERICREICQSDKRVSYSGTTSNQGAAANFKRVFELASGEYFMWAACDDLWSNNYLATLTNALDTSSSILAFASLTSIDEESKKIRDYVLIQELSSTAPTPSQLNKFLWNEESEGKANLIYGLFRRALLDENKLLNRLFSQYGYGSWGSDNLFLFLCATEGNFIAVPDACFYKRVLSATTYNSPNSMDHFHEIQGYFQGYRAIIDSSSSLSLDVKDFLKASVAVKEASWYQREFKCQTTKEVRDLISNYLHTSTERPHEKRIKPCSPVSAINEATELLNRNRINEAENTIKEHLLKQPNDSQAKLLLSKIYRAQERIVDSQVALEEVFEADNNNLIAGKELTAYYYEAAMSAAYAQKVRDLMKVAAYDPDVKRLISNLTTTLNQCHQRKLNFMNLFCGHGDLIFDVGANIGDKAELFLELGSKVVCVEPQPVCASSIRQKFYGNSNVAVEQVGLAEKAGTMTLHVCSSANTITTFSEEWKHGRFSNYMWDSEIAVNVLTLDDLIQKHGTPQYCKIDVEGFEYHVIQGLNSLIPYLSFEFAIEFKESMQQCLEYLYKIGYREFNIAIGEKPELHFAQWVSADKIVNYVVNSRDTMLWGDVYARYDSTVSSSHGHDDDHCKVTPKDSNYYSKDQNNCLIQSHIVKVAPVKPVPDDFSGVLNGIDAFDHKSAQTYEANYAREWCKNNFEQLYHKLNDSLAHYKSCSEILIGEDALHEFFNDSKSLWARFVTQVKGKKGLEIGSGPCGTSCGWHFIEDWHVIDPLVIEYKKTTLAMFGRTWWWDWLNLHPQNAELLLPDLIGQIDGVIVCRNALDHTDDPIQVLNNLAMYAAPGCKLLLWTDLYHTQGHDEGHRNICKSKDIFKTLITNRGFSVDYETPPFRQGETIEYGCVATKI